MGRKFIDIIYEDRDVIVVNKPRGILVVSDRTIVPSHHPAIALTDEVHDYLLHKYPGARGAYVKPLHRLDRETTGLVIFAKSKVGEGLIPDIKSHKVRRVYLAVVEGALQDEGGKIDMPLTKGDFGHGRKAGIALKDEEGKEAVTLWRILERYEDASLLEVELKTGRTHQIRVHMAAIGHPLVGDKVYNPHGRIHFPRQALHAAKLSFIHPVTKKKVVLNAPIPRDMDELIDSLRC